MSSDDFKFQLGDLVMARVGVAEAALLARAGEFALPHLHQVVERILQECPGGVQRHYVCTSDGKSWKCLESELVDQAAFDLGAHLVLLQAGKDARKVREG